MRADPQHRRQLSRWLGAMHLVLCVLWIAPLHGAPLPGRISAVQLLNQMVPVWAPAFGLTGALLLGCSLLHRSMVFPHALGAVVMLVFGALSALSAVWSEPFGSFVPTALSIALCGVHALVQRSYVQVESR